MKNPQQLMAQLQELTHDERLLLSQLIIKKENLSLDLVQRYSFFVSLYDELEPQRIALMQDFIHLVMMCLDEGIDPQAIVSLYPLIKPLIELPIDLSNASEPRLP